MLIRLLPGLLLGLFTLTALYDARTPGSFSGGTPEDPTEIQCIGELFQEQVWPEDPADRLSPVERMSHAEYAQALEDCGGEVRWWSSHPWLTALAVAILTTVVAEWIRRRRDVVPDLDPPKRHRREAADAARRRRRAMAAQGRGRPSTQRSARNMRESPMSAVSGSAPFGEK